MTSSITLADRRELSAWVRAKCNEAGMLMRCKAYAEQGPYDCPEPTRAWRCCALCPRIGACGAKCITAAKVEGEFTGRPRYGWLV